MEVIADDFIIAGFGNTTEEAYKSLECKKRAFFTRCSEWNFKLNKDKVKCAQTNTQFMGLQLTTDPCKIEAIFAQPKPEDFAALKLGFVRTGVILRLVERIL